MALSSHDRKVLAAIEHDLNGQDPKLANLFATARLGGRWRSLLVLLRAIGWLVGVLLALIVVHAATGGLNTHGSATLTGALVVTWLTVTARATRGRRWRPGPASRPRQGSAGSAAGRRAANPNDDRDDPDDDGCCPA